MVDMKKAYSLLLAFRETPANTMAAFARGPKIGNLDLCVKLESRIIETEGDVAFTTPSPI